MHFKKKRIRRARKKKRIRKVRKKKKARQRKRARTKKRTKQMTRWPTARLNPIPWTKTRARYQKHPIRTLNFLRYVQVGRACHCSRWCGGLRRASSMPSRSRLPRTRKCSFYLWKPATALARALALSLVATTPAFAQEQLRKGRPRTRSFESMLEEAKSPTRKRNLCLPNHPHAHHRHLPSFHLPSCHLSSCHLPSCHLSSFHRSSPDR